MHLIVWSVGRRKPDAFYERYLYHMIPYNHIFGKERGNILSTFSVRVDDLRKTQDRINDIKKSIENVSKEVDVISKRVTEISSYEELGKKIDDSVEYLGKVAECAEALGTALGDAVECYSRTESEILQTVTSGASHDNSKSKSADKGEVSDKSYSQDGSRGLVTGNKMIDGFISKLTFDVVKSIVYDQMPEDLKKEVQKSDKTGVIDQLITDLVKYGYDQMFGSSTSMNLVAQAFAAIGRNYIEVE